MIDFVTVKSVLATISATIVVIVGLFGLDSRYQKIEDNKLYFHRLQAAIYSIHYNDLDEKITYLDDVIMSGEAKKSDIRRLKRLEAKKKAMEIEWAAIATKFAEE